MAFAPLRLPVRRAATVSIVGVLVFDAQLLAEASNPGVFILVVNGGAVFFFLLGLLLRREGEQRAEVTRLLEELRASREAEKVAAAMAERSRLAREMHDVLAHTLSGLVLQLEGLKLLALARDADEAVTEGLARAHRLSQTGLTEARQAISALRGGTVPGPAAIADLVAEHRALTGQTCRFLEHGSPRPIAADVALALYRTAQEALSNVRKHAPDAEVDVNLHWERDHVRLVVEDAGLPVTVGVQPPSGSEETPGYGLTGMAERAGLAGGRLEAGPTERGFRVELQLPAPGGGDS
jgi:signal transduction histidine kinase